MKILKDPVPSVTTISDKTKQKQRQALLIGKNVLVKKKHNAL